MTEILKERVRTGMNFRLPETEKYDIKINKMYMFY